MSTSSDIELSSWLQAIDAQMEENHQKREAPFEALINAYNESLQREEAALDEQEILHEQMAKLEADYSAAQRELDSLKTSTGQGMDSRKYQELENKYRFAKQERMELLRTQSVNSQKLLELNEQVKRQELVKERLEHEIRKLQTDVNNNGKQLEYYSNLMDEKNLNIQVLQDELQLLQLELIKTDERVKDLEKENQRLVQRWLNKVNEAADQLNAEVERSSSSLHSRTSLSIAANPHVQWSFNVEHDFHALITSPLHDVIVPLPSGLNGRIQVFQQSEPVQILASIGSDMRLSAGTFTRDADMFLGVPANDKSSACIWSLHSRRRLENLTGGVAAPFIDIVPLASSNSAVVGLHSPDTLRLYDVPRSFCLWTENVAGSAVAISSLCAPSGSDLIASLMDDGRISLWDIRQRKVAFKSSHQSLPRILALHSEPSRDSLIACSDRAIFQLDVRNLRPLSTLKYSPAPFTQARPAIKIMPGTNAFALVTGQQGFVGDFSSKDLKPVGPSPISSLAWVSDRSSNLPYLAVSDASRCVQVIDVRSL